MKRFLGTIVIILIVVCGGLYWLNKDNGIAIVKNDDIGITPTQIQSIKDIGEWEFLAISDEEIVDTMKYGFFGDSELVRIYYGTLRIGVNLHETSPQWLRMEGDTVVATLPPVKLLDNDFIDEARTRSFFESGSWAQKDRQAMYDRAYRTMKERCLTEENLQTAEENARQQFSKLLKTMGYEHVRISFEQSK